MRVQRRPTERRRVWRRSNHQSGLPAVGCDYDRSNPNVPAPVPIAVVIAIVESADFAPIEIMSLEFPAVPIFMLARDIPVFLNWLNNMCRLLHANFFMRPGRKCAGGAKENCSNSQKCADSHKTLLWLSRIS